MRVVPEPGNKPGNDRGEETKDPMVVKEQDEEHSNDRRGRWVQRWSRGKAVGAVKVEGQGGKRGSGLGAGKYTEGKACRRQSKSGGET